MLPPHFSSDVGLLGLSVVSHASEPKFLFQFKKGSPK